MSSKSSKTSMTKKRIPLKSNMFDKIHWKKDSGGPEQFELIIHVESMQEIKQLKSQILKEHEKYPSLEKIKNRLESKDKNSTK